MIHLDLTIVREESQTSLSMLSCPPTPALNRETSELDSDSKNQSKNTPLSLKPLNNEYRLSNRKFRQLSPLEQQTTPTASLTVDNTTEGFINHAYLIESLYNQLSTTDSTASPPPIDSDSAPPLPSIDSDSAPPLPSIDNDSAAAAPPPPLPTSSAPSSMTTGSPSPPILQLTIAQNARHMWSVICILMKNTRYIFIIIASLFEGILIKGRSCILVYFLHIL